MPHYQQRNLVQRRGHAKKTKGLQSERRLVPERTSQKFCFGNFGGAMQLITLALRWSCHAFMTCEADLIVVAYLYIRFSVDERSSTDFRRRWVCRQDP